MDFTLKKYHMLLKCLLTQSFTFKTFGAFIQVPSENQCIILRHDVDRRPYNALRIANMEHELGISSSYYFRTVPSSWDENIIRDIADLDHEIGYHYENLSVCNGDPDRAWSDFQANLEKLRRLAPVKTICMHGSPLSRINNMDLWKTYDYKTLGIIGDPYLDVDYKKVFYLSDTGRKWNNTQTSIRDKVDSGFDIPVHNTYHLTELSRQNRLPDQMMINVHPHRWFDFGPGWVKELVGQNIKNLVKTALIKRRP